MMKPKEPEKLFDVILNSIADGVFTTDGKGKITFFNRAAEVITGFTDRDALGRFCFDIFRADICQSRCALKETLRTKKEITNLPVTILNKEGKRVPISISTAVLKSTKGQIIGGVETFRDLSTIEELRKELHQKYTVGDIVSKNHQIHQIFGVLPNISESDSTVLIQGPSGTGKELFAKAIHHLSRRKEKPFVHVNCGALPDALLESELFGYVKGAFTDAKKDKPGRFSLADGGTIFLDEVGDMSPALQVKLLRVIQEREYEPLGSVTSRKTDARIVAATNKDLAELVSGGKFREDLFYRLNVVKIELPPLSQRKEDIPLLVDAFIQKFNAKMGRQISGLSEQALRVLLRHEYPGNVRELENIIEHAFVLCRGDRIDLSCLPKELTDAGIQRSDGRTVQNTKPLKRSEADVIKETLRKHGGSRRETATELGIDRTTLWRKMKEHRLH
jgi:PAS domain S-box-containing protein